MYEYISGKVAELGSTYAVIDVGGVGYMLSISLNTYSQLEGQQSALLYTHFVVREDMQALFGFCSKEERDLFRLLIGVSGVGGNTARMILSTYGPEELMNIISSGNAVLLKNVKGLGIKTAQKIIVDLAGKMVDVRSSSTPALGKASYGVPYEEALSALVSLGFQKGASEKTLSSIFASNPSVKVEDAVRLALKQM